MENVPTSISSISLLSAVMQEHSELLTWREKMLLEFRAERKVLAAVGGCLSDERTLYDMLLIISDGAC